MHDPDFVNFAPRRDFTRRDFVTTTLATGFAVAVQPVSASTVITTDTRGLAAGEVMIPVKDGAVPAFRAMPEGGRNLATVLVVQEIFGVHEHIKDICRRFAKRGYLAIAPELYARQGDVSRATGIDEIWPIVAKVPDPQVMADRMGNQPLLHALLDSGERETVAAFYDALALHEEPQYGYAKAAAAIRNGYMPENYQRGLSRAGRLIAN